MTHPHLLMLGQIEIEPKVIFGVIFFVIWALSALISWANKQQQEAKRRQVRESLERSAMRQRMQQPQPSQPPAPRRIAEGLAQRFPDVQGPPAPLPPAPQRRPAPPPLPPPMPQQRPAPIRRPAKKPRRVIPAAPPPPVVTEEPIVATASLLTPAATVAQATARASAPTVSADRVRAWLTPATLRQQFILTEILQPPLSLRPERFTE